MDARFTARKAAKCASWLFLLNRDHDSPADLPDNQHQTLEEHPGAGSHLQSATDGIALDPDSHQVAMGGATTWSAPVVFTTRRNTWRSRPVVGLVCCNNRAVLTAPLPNRQALHYEQTSALPASTEFDLVAAGQCRGKKYRVFE